MNEKILRPVFAWGMAFLSIYGIFTFKSIPANNVIVFLLSFGLAYFINTAFKVHEHRIQLYSSIAASLFATIELVGFTIYSNWSGHSLSGILHHLFRSLLFLTANFVVFYVFFTFSIYLPARLPIGLGSI